MKIKGLQLLSKQIYLGDSGRQGSCDNKTHDIETIPEGYACRHRVSGTVYIVPWALAVGELDPATEDDADEPPVKGRTAGEPKAEKVETKREPSARGKVGSRIRAPQSPEDVQG